MHFHWSIEENYYVEYKYLVYNGYMTGYSKNDYIQMLTRLGLYDQIQPFAKGTS